MFGILALYRLHYGMLREKYRKKKEMTDPCPVNPPQKKIETPKPKSNWRKAYMIDLNTLDTDERWESKLSNITPSTMTCMLRVLRKMQIMTYRD